MDIVSSVRNVIIVQEDPENPGEGYLELAVGMEVPLTNLGICRLEPTSYKFQRRPSLPVPEESSVTWEEYIAEPAGSPPCLGRPWVAKGNTKSFKATVAMSKNFPMSIDVLLDVLEVIAPFKQFQKLREFMTTKLPDGFPVKIEIPVFPTVTAKVTFTSFDWRDDIDDAMFVVPPNYRENPNRFPDL
eukprot:XP_011437185.1 PREDICTED: ankyrin repeat domain-containing protein 13C-B [Crassostrea gigas]